MEARTTHSPTEIEEKGMHDSWVGGDKVVELGASTVQGVPALRNMELDHIWAHFCRKDGAFVFHFYHPARRAIYLKAHEDLDRVGADADMEPHRKQIEMQKISADANAELAEHTGWMKEGDAVPQIGHDILAAQKEEFGDAECRISYFQEVDSWSLIMPVPNLPVPVSDDRMASVVVRLNRIIANQ